MFKYLFIALITMVVISGCRYSKPLFSHKTYSFTYRDTLTNNIYKKNNYRYTNLFNFSSKGGYVELKRYEIVNGSFKLINKTCTKTTSLDMFETNEKIYEKIYTYENEKKTEVEFSIYQTNGKYRNLSSKTIISFNDGKKTKQQF